MNQEFFEKEIQRVRHRFNQTFGLLPVCDLKLRQSVILNVCCWVSSRNACRTEEWESDSNRHPQVHADPQCIETNFQSNRIELNQRRQRHDRTPTANHTNAG